MKKKLLLSFAVFATALSVNAQKKVSNYSLNGVKSPKHVSVVSNELENPSSMETGAKTMMAERTMADFTLKVLRI